ncbi:hypothetical protein [Coleofasciculus sp. E2-BRE-01]|uniref:hypothetical protein n=1 Tax=Coleofasciculus sp. E2-BRE-01 TaxID=3069524 RepID=UPI003303CD55
MNQFKQDHGVELVVCSRIKDYEALSNRLNFQSAVYIRLLNLEQIYNYLNSVGADLTGLRTLIVEDTVLQELAQSPLMLNIMTLAYQGVAVENLPKTEVLEERRRQLFDDYIENMFKRRKTNQRYKSVQVKRWLIWLATRIVQKSQTVFFIEKMQPYLLINRKSEQIYKLIYRLIFGLVFMLVGRLVFMSIVGLVFILIVGLIVGLMKRKNPEEIKTVEIVRFNWNKFKNNLIGSLIGSLIVRRVNKEVNKEVNKLIELMGPEEVLNTLIGSIFWWLARTIIWLIGALIEALIEGLTRGFENSEIETKTSPNEGIWKSVRNAIRFGLIVGLIFRLISGGNACIKHFSLRLILYCNNYIPWNYAHFLDYATDRIFLQKVGGGYIFIHRMLMEHFAQMELER